MKIAAIKWKICIIIFLASCIFAAAQDLSVLSEDVRIIQSPEGGYNLYIRKKPDIESVLITETTRDPAMRENNYTYRVTEYNTINGDEPRILDGRFLHESSERALYFLTDSSPEADPVFGEAFHIWIPYILVYGFPETRHGEVQVLDGTFLNIRAFEKPYADYSGAFEDNPYRLRLTQVAVERPPERDVSIYMTDTVNTFGSLAGASGGKLHYAGSPSDIAPLVREMLDGANLSSLDLVFAIDATESMKNDIAEVRKSIPRLLSEMLPEGESWRVALVVYKDYSDEFLVKTACEFTQDMEAFAKSLRSFAVKGGRDIPEAVHEAIDSALGLPWENAERKIILIGDAPAHPMPRGNVTRESVIAKASELNVQVDAIILPHGETY